MVLGPPVLAPPHTKGGRRSVRRPSLIHSVPTHRRATVMSTAAQTCTGVLEMHPRGHGYLRDPARNFRVGPNDVYVGPPLLARFQLRQGVRLTGLAEGATRGEGPRLADLLEIEGRTPDEYLGLRVFDERTAIDPHERVRLETGPEPLGMRVMDLL